MKRFILCVLMLFSIQAFSQKVFFIYLQTEGGQPFFVKLNDRVQSSTASGYLILSRLRDSTYKFTVGFPQNQYPEQQFSVTMNRRDHGFIIKNFGEKGWGLYNLNDLSVQMATVASSGPVKTGNEPVSAFTDILSRAADDPSLKEKPILPPEEKSEVQVIEVAKKETPRQVTAEPAVIKQEEIKKEEPQKTESPKEVPKIEDTKTLISKPVAEVTSPENPGVITRQSENSTAEGFKAVYIDETANGRDTIEILIPQPKSLVQVVKEEPLKEEPKLEEPKKKEPKKEEPRKEEPKFIDTEIKPTSDNLPVKTRINKCNAVATDNDFLKLRKKMASENDDDDMVDEARKYFKTTCFTTIQMKNLSTLFLDDLGKYKFFDLAYIFVSDLENFPSLESELKNEYYINRFRAMLK